MHYFRSASGEVFAYDDEQVAMGYGSDMTPMTQQEVDEWLNPPPTAEQLAAEARRERDGQLAMIYDKGINMALRAARVATDPSEKAYAEAKVAELDAYAIALTEIPEQPGFPQSIVWPEIPSA